MWAYFLKAQVSSKVTFITTEVGHYLISRICSIKKKKNFLLLLLIQQNKGNTFIVYIHTHADNLLEI